MTSRERRGWFMVLVLFVTLAVTIGAQDCFGVLFTPLLKHFGWSHTRLSTAMSVSGLVGGACAALAGWLIDRVGARLVMAGGAAAAGIGLLIGSQANSFALLVLGCALFGAGAGGASSLVASLVIGYWFGENRGFAMGVTVMGTSFGAGLMAPLINHIVQRVGWRWGYATLAAAELIVAAPMVGIFLRTRPPEQLAHGDAGDQAIARGGLEVSEALASRAFWLYSLIFLLFLLSAGAVNMHMMPLLVGIGFAPANAAWALTSYYVGATLTKPLMGVLADRMGVRQALCFAFLMMALACLGMVRIPNHALLLMLAIIYGFGVGGPVALMPLLGIEVFGLRRYGTLTGMASLTALLAAAIGPISAGALFDFYGSYSAAFTLLGVILITAAILPFACNPFESSEPAQAFAR